MNIRKIVFAAVTVAALTPAISNASPEKASVKACASAFASTVTNGAAAPGYKLAYRTSFGSALADFYPTEYTFTTLYFHIGTAEGAAATASAVFYIQPMP